MNQSFNLLKRSSLIVLFIVQVQTNLLAQFEDSVKVLEPVVITPTKFEKKPEETGRSVTVIPNEQIENSAYTNVGELLSAQEGIFVAGAGQNPGSTQSIFTRGSNSNHTLILIDGVRITDPSGVNNAVELSELSLSNVERIEIVRGSHGTLYGTGAIGATINIVTKKNDKKGLSGFTELKGGTFGKNTFLSQENVYLNYTFANGFYVNGNLISMQVKGMDATAELPKPEGAYNKQDRDDFTKLDAGLKVGYKKGKWDVFGSYRYNNQRYDIDNAAFEEDDNAFIRFWRDYVNAGVSYKVSEKLMLKGFGGLSLMSRKTENDSSVIDYSGNYDQAFSWSLNQGGIYTFELQSLLNLKGIHMVLGTGYYGETMTSESYYWSPFYSSMDDLDTLNLSSHIGYAFVYTELNGVLISDKLKAFTLGLGGRYNKHDSFGDNFTWQVNPSLKVSDKSLLYFSLSTGFNAPSLYQLYNPSDFALGNSELKPETSFTYEGGFKQTTDNLSVQVSVYNTIVEDMIQYVRLEDTATMITNSNTYINISEMTTTGAELAVRTKLSDKVAVSGNAGVMSGSMTYSLADVNMDQIGGNFIYFNGDKVTDEKVKTLELSRRPSYTAGLGLTYTPVKKLSVDLFTRFVGERTDAYYDANIFSTVSVTLESYALTDLQINYKMNKSFMVNLRVENLFNKEYYEIAGYNTRRRGVFLKARYSF